MGDEKKTGRKLEDEVRDFLKEASLSLAPGEVQRAQAMTEIRKAVRKKIIQRQPSLRELLMVELRYISPGFWVLQGSLVLLLAALLEKTSLDGGRFPTICAGFPCWRPGWGCWAAAAWDGISPGGWRSWSRAAISTFPSSGRSV